MGQLLHEAGRMPDAATRFASDVYEVRTLNTWFHCAKRFARTTAGSSQGAINDRFRTTGATDDCVNVFYAAGEMALMERVGRARLQPEDRLTLRHLWENLLDAK